MPGKLLFSDHARRRMLERDISATEVAAVLRDGSIVERYPDDTPYPSKLVAGWTGHRHLHVVAAELPSKAETVVITVYEPNDGHWESPLARRKS